MVFVMYVGWKQQKLLEKLKEVAEPKLDQPIYMNLDVLSTGNQDKYYYLFNLSSIRFFTTLGSAKVVVSPN